MADFEDVYQTTQNIDDTLAAIEVLAEPWFLTLNLKSCHTPFHVPPQHLHTHGYPSDDLGKYMAMVEAVDTEIGRLVGALDLQTTTVFLLSDNGTPGKLTHPPNSGKATIREGGVNCPLIVAGRGVEPGARTTALASGVDLYETTVALMGGSADTRDGVSLLPVLRNPCATVRSAVFGEMFDLSTGQDIRYARDDQYKLRVYLDTGTELFCDLSLAAPGEDGRALPLSYLSDEEQARLDTLRQIVALPER